MSSRRAWKTTVIPRGHALVIPRPGLAVIPRLDRGIYSQGGQGAAGKNDAA
jgi:hypothetical protein